VVATEAEVAAGRQRRAARQQGGGDSAAVVVAAAMRLRWPLWQLGGSAASSVAALQREARWQRQCGGSGGWQRDSVRHGCGSHRHCRATTARCRSGDEVTAGDSDGRGTDNN